MFHSGWRKRSLDRLAGQFDVAVIGGGITGSGIALDAAQRGLNTVLLEKGDLASGTSSRSSKLIHGGLRYLKQMQLRITRLACRERDRMLNLSPHLVTPIRFIYPAYHGDRTPGWQVDLGLWMYDQLTGRPDKHSQLSAREMGRMAGGVKVQGLDRALCYTDAMTDDARLTVATAATAWAHGCAIISRCEAVEARRNGDGKVTGLVLHDLETGRRLDLDAQVVVNAAGVWTDQVRSALGFTGAHLKPSRGIHLILPHHLLSLQAALTLPSPDDGRPVFLIPHPEGILLGTTDVYHDGPLDDPRPTAAEVDYLLRAASSAFPRQTIGRTHVLGAFAGLRPILDTHADDPSEASREEDIWDEDGMLCVAGGKLTTWRSTAEEAVDRVLELLPEQRAQQMSPCATKGTPLAARAPADLSHHLEEHFGVAGDVASAMTRRLGGMAWFAAETAGADRQLEALAPGLDLCAAEVAAHFRWGAALHLDDLLLRRVRIGMWQPATVYDLLPHLQRPVCSATGWSDSRWQQEEQALGDAISAWTVAGIVG